MLRDQCSGHSSVDSSSVVDTSQEQHGDSGGDSSSAGEYCRGGD